MFRKLTIALVATAALGTAAFTSSAAEAHWRGYGWNGWHGHRLWLRPLVWLRLWLWHGYYGYRSYGFYPRYHGWRHAGWKRFRNYY